MIPANHIYLNSRLPRQLGRESAAEVSLRLLEVASDGHHAARVPTPAIDNVAFLGNVSTTVSLPQGRLLPNETRRGGRESCCCLKQTVKGLPSYKAL